MVIVMRGFFAFFGARTFALAIDAAPQDANAPLNIAVTLYDAAICDSAKDICAS
jgi:hypothetical protein